MKSPGYEFKDLIDTEALGAMLENLYRTARIPSAIIAMNGEVLTEAGWQRICVDFHRVHPDTEKQCIASDTRIRDEILSGNPFVIYECPHGLMDSCCPIIIEGVHLANVFTGQLLHEAPDDALLKRFRIQAAAYGFDEADYLSALMEVPVFSREEHRAMITCLSQLTRYVAKTGLTNLKNLQHARAAEESEAKFRRYFDQAPIGVFIADEQARYVEVNAAAEAITGFSRSELLERSIPDMVPEAELQRVMASFFRLPDDGHVTVETSFHKKDGSLGTWIVDAAKLSDKRFMGFTTDITEKKQREKEQAMLETKLFHSQKMEAIGTLAGGIAHDFNNILGAILGYSDMALEAVEAGSPAHNCVSHIIDAGTRARDLVQRILAFSRSTESEHRPVDLSRLVRGALRLIRATIPSTIEIRRQIEVDEAIISANPTEIDQVLMNLCTNAFHAMEENGGVMSVSLRRAPEGTPMTESATSGFELSVEDTGTGIGEDVLERIFDPFFTTKGIGKGTGMGLAVVHGIVESHGGKVVVKSREGQGTAFTVTFPECVVRQSAVEPPTRSLPPPRGTERILLVDDEAALVDITKAQLEQLGYRVTALMDATEAAALFKKQPDAFDIVLTDQTMPNLKGESLAQEIHQARPATPIVLITGYLSNIDKEKGRESGIRAFVAKPVSRYELAHTVRSALDDAEHCTVRQPSG